MNSGKKDNEKIEALQREITLLKSQWPAITRRIYREELALLADLATHSGNKFYWISTIPD